MHIGTGEQTKMFTLRHRDSELVEAARIAAEEKFINTQKKKLDNELKWVTNHCFPFGSNLGESFDRLLATKGVSWVGHWIESGRREDATATIKLMSKVLMGLYPEIARVTFLNDKGNGKYYGEVGVRQKKVAVTNVGSHRYKGYRGYVFIEKFMTGSGELLIYIGSVYIGCNKGEELVISFGIKEHEVYEGEYQTVIERVKVID